MTALLKLLLHIVVSLFKTKARLEAEIIMLRHQLNVLRRRIPSKTRFAVADRLLFVWPYRLFPAVLNAEPLSSRRRSSSGTGPASACIGAGNRARVAVGKGSNGGPEPDAEDEPGQSPVGRTADLW